MISSNFAAALGLPMESHREGLQAVHRQWQLRRDQFLFLREEADKAAAVRLWDQQHEFVSLSSSPLMVVHDLPTQRGG